MRKAPSKPPTNSHPECHGLASVGWLRFASASSNRPAQKKVSDKTFEGFKPKAQGSEAPEGFREPRRSPNNCHGFRGRGIEAGAGLFNSSAQVSRFRGVDKPILDLSGARDTRLKTGEPEQGAFVHPSALQEHCCLTATKQDQTPSLKDPRPHNLEETANPITPKPKTVDNPP